MKTTNNLPATSATIEGSSCHGAGYGSAGGLGRGRGFALAAAAMITGIALGLSQHWFTFRDLVPLLYVLPCAAMMFMCMKGMNHHQQTGKPPASARSDMPAHEN